MENKQPKHEACNYHGTLACGGCTCDHGFEGIKYSIFRDEKLIINNYFEQNKIYRIDLVFYLIFQEDFVSARKAN